MQLSDLNCFQFLSKSIKFTIIVAALSFIIKWYYILCVQQIKHMGHIGRMPACLQAITCISLKSLYISKNNLTVTQNQTCHASYHKTIYIFIYGHAYRIKESSKSKIAKHFIIKQYIWSCILY